MKYEYEKPEMEIVEFSEEEVMTLDEHEGSPEYVGDNNRVVKV